jgi:hypothetical protein
MASGDGACADAVQIENSMMLAMIERRLNMGFSGERPWDDTRKSPFPKDSSGSHRNAKGGHDVPEHDPEKWTPVFRKDHAQSKS